MKKLFFSILLTGSLGLMAQDTTSFRMISISSSVEFDFFSNDSSSLDYITCNLGSTGHAIFVNPADSLLYALIDANGSGDRNLYKVNPLTGNAALFYNFSTSYFNSADIAENGMIYLIEGVANNNNGLIHEYNPSNNSISSWKQCSVGADPRGLEYNPVDSSVYVFVGYSSTSYKIDLATKTETSFSTTGLTSPEIHGGYFDDNANVFFLCSYYGELLTTPAPWTTATQYRDMNDPGGTGNTAMDMTMFRTIKTQDTVSHCPGDSSKLEGLYTGSTYTWYRDGAPAGLSGRVVYATQPGTYTAVMSVTMNSSTNYIMSEPIEVMQYTIPIFSITNADNDTLICDGDTIVLNGPNGNQLQWFKDGDTIPGATGTNYEAMAVGSYNMIKINQSGCSDSANAPYVIYPEAPSVCYQGINEAEAIQIQFYPNPVDDILYIKSNDLINAVEVFNMEGKMISQSILEGRNQIELNVTEYPKGSYLVKVISGETTHSRVILK